MTSQIQSVIFKTDKLNKWNVSRAKKWLKENKLVPIKPVDITTNSLRFRLNPPEKYIDFRTKVSSGEYGEILFVVGIQPLKSPKKRKKRKKKKKLMMKVQ